MRGSVVVVLASEERVGDILGRKGGFGSCVVGLDGWLDRRIECRVWLVGGVAAIVYRYRYIYVLGLPNVRLHAVY